MYLETITGESTQTKKYYSSLICRCQTLRGFESSFIAYSAYFFSKIKNSVSRLYLLSRKFLLIFLSSSDECPEHYGRYDVICVSKLYSPLVAMATLTVAVSFNIWLYFFCYGIIKYKSIFFSCVFV